MHADVMMSNQDAALHSSTISPPKPYTVKWVSPCILPETDILRTPNGTLDTYSELNVHAALCTFMNDWMKVGIRA